MLHVTTSLCILGRSLFGNIQEEVVKDTESVRNQQQQHVQQYSCTLDDCFQLYTKEEQVASLLSFKNQWPQWSYTYCHDNAVINVSP